MAMVEIQNLSKSYGSVVAVEEFSMSANRSEIAALVGPDGAGKTSIFRAACGLVSYSAGTITIADHDVAREFTRIKPLLGYMPQNFSLYPDLSVEENLSFYAGLFGLSRQEYEDRKQRLYVFSGLGPFHDRRASALSGGMKQKLALSCNLIHDPQVLILDEPTTGVDPLSRRQFWDILKSLRNQGSTIIVSTPYMDEVALADRAMFIHRGKKLAEGTPQELVKQFRGMVYQINIDPTIELMHNLEQRESLSARRFGSTVHLYSPDQLTFERHRGELQQIGIGRESCEMISPSLEDTFIQLMEK